MRSLWRQRTLAAALLCTPQSQRRAWMFRPRDYQPRRGGPIPNRDGKDGRALELMAAHPKLSLMELTWMLKLYGISRSKEWCRTRRTDGCDKRWAVWRQPSVEGSIPVFLPAKPQAPTTACQSPPRRRTGGRMGGCGVVGASVLLIWAVSCRQRRHRPTTTHTRVPECWC